MAKKKAGYEAIVADDGGGALVLPRNADPKLRKEAEDMFKTVKDGFARLVALEVGKTRVALYKPRTEDKRGWLFMDQSGHSYYAARADDSKMYVATCSRFPTLKWIARTKKNALAGIRNVVKVAEQAIHTYEIVWMAEINQKEIEAVMQKEPGKRQIMVFSSGIPAGVLSEYERNASYVFVYLPSYVGPPISLAMPVDERAFTFDRFPAFFDAFLPEGRNYEEFLKRTGLERDDYMSQLLAVGRHSKITVPRL